MYTTDAEFFFPDVFENKTHFSKQRFCAFASVSMRKQFVSFIADSKKKKKRQLDIIRK